MKIYFLFFLIIPVNLFSQNCQLKDERDRYNQGIRLTTGFKSIGVGSDKFLISISADKKEVDLFFVLENSGFCFNEFSRATVKYENKQSGSFKNGGTTNCKGFFHFIFPNQENLNTNLINLGLKKISSIHFTGNDNVKKIITIQPQDNEIILNAVNCLLIELEKLRLDTWKPTR